jgi:hypothetical protein
MKRAVIATLALCILLLAGCWNDLGSAACTFRTCAEKPTQAEQDDCFYAQRENLWCPGKACGLIADVAMRDNCYLSMVQGLSPLPAYCDKMSAPERQASCYAELRKNPPTVSGCDARFETHEEITACWRDIAQFGGVLEPCKKTTMAADIQACYDALNASWGQRAVMNCNDHLDTALQDTCYSVVAKATQYNDSCWFVNDAAKRQACFGLVT